MLTAPGSSNMAAEVDSDLLLAIQLQEQFDSEAASSTTSSSTTSSSSSSCSSFPPLSIVDSSWEAVDPTPDLRALFLQFNSSFFWGKVSGVEVKWSSRMTLCAGVCSYEGRGGLCSIRLSEPLLKLRPRRDLVQTLLHEMIHAFLFVTQNNRDRDGHGPEFCKHMDRINRTSGTKITIYHSFTEEVDVYRQHWWRCGGPCRGRGPYFGYVKRAMNRAPGPLDPWWGGHSSTCGGVYTKVKEPPGYGSKGRKEGKKEGKKEGGKEGKKVGGKETSVKASSHTAGSSSQAILPFSGTGFVLGGTSQKPSSSSPFLTPSSSSITSSSSSITSSSSSSITSSITSSSSSIASSSSSSSSSQKKRSVGNTRVFINTNGSPMKIHKPSSIPRNHGNRSIMDLFNGAQSRPVGPPRGPQ